MGIAIGRSEQGEGTLASFKNICVYLFYFFLMCGPYVNRSLQKSEEVWDTVVRKHMGAENKTRVPSKNGEWS